MKKSWPENEPNYERGLSLEDVVALERTAKPKPISAKKYGRILEAMRLKYATDPFALEEIDRYDENSAFAKQRAAYVEAIKNNDALKIASIESWFSKNYPLSYKKSEKL